MDIVKEKILQTKALLDEHDLDLWLVYVRETSMLSDPVVPLVVGDDVTWESFFAFSRTHGAIALVGNFDLDIFQSTGRFDVVASYVHGVRKDFLELLDRLHPKRIGLNYSTNNVASDGLSHGLFLKLREYLQDTPYVDRLESAESFVTALRSRKNTEEQRRLTTSAIMAQDVWREAISKIETGMTEVQIADLIDQHTRQLGGVPSFETIVNAGAKTNPGHGHPTDAVLEPGDLLHVDFGIKFDDYCSDIQRLAYFRTEDDSQQLATLTDAFDCVKEIITETAKITRPGVQGCEIDKLARTMLVERGYSEYQHALGHQLGRSVHDGGALIGPSWERYGDTPTLPLELGSVFTLELEIFLPGIGTVGLEEDVCVTEQGARFLCPRQMELIIK